MNFSSNIVKAESKTSSLLVSFTEAKAYICPTGQIYNKVESRGKIYFHYAEAHQYKCARQFKYTENVQAAERISLFIATFVSCIGTFAG